jgi:hypothetical protein
LVPTTAISLRSTCVTSGLPNCFFLANRSWRSCQPSHALTTSLMWRLGSMPALRRPRSAW